MDEVRDAVIERAVELDKDYTMKGLQKKVPFKGVGMAYIKFAQDEPQLFRLLFMSEPKESYTVSSMIDLFNRVSPISDSIEGPYAMDKEKASKLFQHMWIYTHGIATMCVNGLCSYTDEEISERLSEVFNALLDEEKTSATKKS